MAGKGVLVNATDKKGSTKVMGEQQYYILLKDHHGLKLEKRFRAHSYTSTTKKFITIPKGEILTKLPEQDQPKDKIMISLSPFERPSYIVECPRTDVQELDKEDADLLLPLCSMGARLKILQERDKLKSGKKMNVGSPVWATVTVNHVAREYKGVIKYKGPLPGNKGTMFGVELVDCTGKGTTDGCFKSKYYFHCKKDDGVFVSLDKLSSRKELEQSGNKQRTTSNSRSAWYNDDKHKNNEEKNKLKHSLPKSNGLKPEDTVWISIGGKLQKGVLKFIGDYTSKGKGLVAGIKMDTPCGKGHGWYCGEQVFSCDEGYAYFAPIETVLSKKAFDEMNSQPNGYQEPSKELSFEKNKARETSSISMRPSHTATKHFSCKVQEPVWVFIDDKPQRGVIKFIGREPGGVDMLAGIEMDNPCGKGDGEYHGKQLFVCARDHAHFTPTVNVISKAKFKEMYEPPSTTTSTKPSDLKDEVTPAPAATCTDIVEMESKFANQSKAEVIQEQREIFRKLQEASINAKQSHGASKEQNCSNGLFSEKEDKTLLSQVQRVRDLNGDVTSPRSSSRVKYDGYDNTRRVNDAAHMELNHHNTAGETSQRLDIGSMVEVLSKIAAPKYGVIRWIGFVANSNKKIAGLELEEEMDACSDGTFLGQRYFTCPKRKGFFVHLHNCLPDSRFSKGGQTSQDKRLLKADFGSFESPTIDDRFILPPEDPWIYTKRGVPRGIQGHHNSCYLDATLFASFAFSSVLDTVLLREKGENDIDDYEQVQNVLRNNIIYPLRAYGFVRADRVLELRQLLDKLGTVTGLVGEEKDPEEFLLTLFQQVLNSEPFLKIKSGKDVINEYFYQVFADKDVERVLPSVEELLKRSFHQSNLKLAEVPSCLIVQMPRFGKGFKMYKRILPSLTINIGELVDNAPQDCTVCGRLAKFHCKDCFSLTGFSENDSSGNFCQECSTRYHSHTRRAKHDARPLVVSKEICKHYADRPVEHQEMELFAVVCIETSHYVTFVRCNDSWCFFDSMADRVGSKDGYNIPAVTECPEVVEWLSSEKQNRERIINSDDKELPDRIRRILGDAYMCFYQSKEMAMYR